MPLLDRSTTSPDRAQDGMKPDPGQKLSRKGAPMPQEASTPYTAHSAPCKKNLSQVKTERGVVPTAHATSEVGSNDVHRVNAPWWPPRIPENKVSISLCRPRGGLRLGSLPGNTRNPGGLAQEGRRQPLLPGWFSEGDSCWVLFLFLTSQDTGSIRHGQLRSAPRPQKFEGRSSCALLSPSSRCFIS